MRLTCSALCPLLFLLSACHGHGGHTPDGYGGCATDENAQLFDDYEGSGRIKTDAAQGPRWKSPMTGAAVPASTAPVFAWEPSPADPGRPNGNVMCEQCPTCSLSPQHLPPISGNVFDLRFKVAGADVYRVVTTLQQFTPPVEVWSAWRGKDLTVDLVGSALLRNDVAQGPFRGPPLAVKVQP